MKTLNKETKKVLVSKSCYECFLKIEKRTKDWALWLHAKKVIELYQMQNN